MSLLPHSESVAHEVREIARVAPQLLPLWRKLREDVRAKGRGTKPKQILHDLKQEAIERGLTLAGWRYLCHLPEKWVAEGISWGHPRVDCCLGTVNQLARVGQLPTEFEVFQGASIYIQGCSSMLGFVPEEIVALARAAFRRSREWTGEGSFYEEFKYVAGWCSGAYIFRDKEYGYAGPLDDNQKRAPWEWFLRRAIHCWITNHGLLPPYFNGRSWERYDDGKVWDTVIAPFEYRGLEVVPLTSVRELYEESAALRHCVYSYAERCRRGVSQILSVREEGEPRATFEVACRNGDWTLTQVRGRRNWVPRENEIFAAREALRRVRLTEEERRAEAGISRRVT